MATTAAVGLPKRATLKLENNLSYKLSILNFLMGKVTASIYRSKDLSVHQWKVLSVLYAHEPMPASDILRWVTLDKAAISRAVRQLQRLELIERKLHPIDGRSVNISLSAQGRELYTRMSEEMAVLQASILAGYSEEKVKVFLAMLSDIEQRLRDA
ncbi:MarR family winged helix-turn-helix transcriptional regulator [Reyranella sp. CPCC 100927]|uniref:MarR family winged helix-turn-helix transcriptional regulator n=1 Tax=Reyranella sp. CPCC 100927 TaxID=2599616 RepID=UPI0011B6CD06|nr:MarR family transcriptional regulator [Reyranella sp. CPCC 100927]TWS99833.1 MarR family transcriptional regulator [Reyranella sp. CPCC 100927]